MSKIKTREKGKDIKVLDKSAMIGQRSLWNRQVWRST